MTKERPGFRKCFASGGGFPVWVPVQEESGPDTPRYASQPVKANPEEDDEDDGPVGCSPCEKK